MMWPVVSHATNHVARKGEDFHSFHELTWRRHQDDSSDRGVNFLAFGVYDGHGGTESGEYVKNNLVPEFVRRLSELSSLDDPTSTKTSSRTFWDAHHVQAIRDTFLLMDEKCR